MTLSYSATGMEDEDFTVCVDQQELPEGTALQTLEFEPVTARYLKVYVDEGHNDFASPGGDRGLPHPGGRHAPQRAPESDGPGELGGGALHRLEWESAADPESSVANYSIYRDGRFLDVVTGTQYTDTGVEAQGTYRYEVVATNGAGLDGEAAALEVSVTEAPKTFRIPQEQMTATASSEETLDEAGTNHGFASNAIDGDSPRSGAHSGAARTRTASTPAPTGSRLTWDRCIPWITRTSCSAI